MGYPAFWQQLIILIRFHRVSKRFHSKWNPRCQSETLNQPWKKRLISDCHPCLSQCHSQSCKQKMQWPMTSHPPSGHSDERMIFKDLLHSGHFSGSTNNRSTSKSQRSGENSSGNSVCINSFFHFSCLSCFTNTRPTDSSRSKGKKPVWWG